MGTPTCGDVAAACVCAEPEGHVEDGQDVHKCSDRDKCKGEWRRVDGEVDPLVYPGGLTHDQAVLRMLSMLLGVDE